MQLRQRPQGISSDHLSVQSHQPNRSWHKIRALSVHSTPWPACSFYRLPVPKACQLFFILPAFESRWPFSPTKPIPSLMRNFSWNPPINSLIWLQSLKHIKQLSMSFMFRPPAKTGYCKFIRTTKRRKGSVFLGNRNSDMKLCLNL
jgi:hypothetical protein